MNKFQCQLRQKLESFMGRELSDCELENLLNGKYDYLAKALNN